MKKFRSLLVLAAFLGCACVWTSAAGAPNAPDAANETGAAAAAAALPRRFEGGFKWNDRVLGSEVAVKLTSVRAVGGLIWAEGEGRHVEEYFRTNIAVELVIDPATLAVEMWEKSPRGTRDNPKFATEGSYRGEISPDWKTIRAIWTTTATGRKGVLTIKAN
ncbi:MAG: hypothetical protein HQK81_02605 [Desulfovibrionaceae bacterium]|nr:hypothetical protein [Desulfovibrionaceae bacterium]MBF0512936.1 hypothetical protein [Desulfovibrionaceae bacterium]